MADGPAVPCPSCGYTALVVSARPPARDDEGAARWAAALLGCMVVSGLVIVCAMTLARLAEADDDSQTTSAGALPSDVNCETTLPACVDPSLWAAHDER